MPEFLLFAQAAPPSAAALGSVWDFLVKGGVLMIPIGICSLAVLAVTVERLVSLRKRNVIPPDFLTGVQAAIGRGGNSGRSAALDYCKKSDSPIGRIFVAALQRIGEPADLLEKHIEQAGQREVFKLRKYLRLLSVIASVATLLGLLGTIFGMITAFSTVAASGEALGRTELLARGIYEALITTAAGLMVSIPALLAFHGFAARIDHIVRDVDAMTVDFVESLRRTDDKPALVAEAA
ncbi:MAG: MotA/TolQ/ExbB proton channel family protein [Phycisphaerae bacterium]